MRSPDEIKDRLAELELEILHDDDDGSYLDEGQQAESMALAWVLDRDYDFEEILQRAKDKEAEQEKANDEISQQN